MQDGWKAVWSIPYVSVAFLKQNFIAYHSSKVSDYIFEIPQLWQSDLVGCIPIPTIAVDLKLKS